MAPTIGTWRLASNPPMPSPFTLLIGETGSRRNLAWQHACDRVGMECRQLSWYDALNAPERIRLPTHGKLRVDSPGADPKVWSLLSGLPPFHPGERRPGAAWAAGLRQALCNFEFSIPQSQWLSSAPAIMTMVDKWATYTHLQSKVPQPITHLAGPTMEALLDQIATLSWGQAFIKPRFGSSGAGVVALRRGPKGRLRATTPARLEAGRVFNHKRLFSTEDPAIIAQLLNPVLEDGALLQRWIPKLAAPQGPMDFRVVVVGGRATVRVARVGQGPITNLHLNAERAPFSEVLSPEAQARVLSTAESTARCFSGATLVGVDLALDLAHHPFVLECNAWGDHLPGLLWQGKDSQDWQVQHFLQPLGCLGGTGEVAA
jgi:glutathione synthase/RimK-type ligase-like ATP-grasp enzyme